MPGGDVVLRVVAEKGASVGQVLADVEGGFGRLGSNVRGSMQHLDGELLEAWSGTPARCKRRSWTKQWAKITASIAEINSANIGYFLAAGSEVLSEVNIVFTHTEPDGGVTITVSLTANVIPTGGMKFREDTWTLTGVEFRSVGDALVSVTAM